MSGMKVSVKGLAKLNKAFKKYEDNKQRAISKAIKKGAIKVHRHAVDSILRGSPRGRVYQRGSVSHKASAPGQPPATDTGTLASSIAFEIDKNGKGSDVRARARYAKSLEFGTLDMEPRPFMGPALNANRKEILEDIKKAMKGLK